MSTAVKIIYCISHKSKRFIGQLLTNRSKIKLPVIVKIKPHLQLPVVTKKSLNSCIPLSM